MTKTKYYIEKIIETFKKSGYYDLMKGFLTSSEMDHLIRFLETESISGNRFSPSMGQVFNPFLATPPDKLHAILVSTWPVEELGHSNGLAFGVKPTVKRMVKHPVYSFYEQVSENPNCEPSLKFLTDQGVLLLNLGSTSPLDKFRKKDHLKNWYPFVSYFLDMVNNQMPDIPVVLFGQQPSELKELFTNDQAFCAPTPDIGKVKTIFEECNKWLKKSGKCAIVF